MRNAGLDESQTGIKIARRNINNIRHAYDTTLIAESEKELKNLLMRVKEESEKAGLKLLIQKTKTMASSLITSWKQWQIFIFLSSKIIEDGECSHEIKRSLLLQRKAMRNIGTVLKNRNFTLLRKLYMAKAMVFPVL